MRSADVSAGASGPPALPQRLMHSHNAAASGHRTTEELLTALRKVKPYEHLSTITTFSGCCLVQAIPTAYWACCNHCMPYFQQGLHSCITFNSCFHTARLLVQCRELIC